MQGGALFREGSPAYSCPTSNLLCAVQHTRNRDGLALSNNQLHAPAAHCPPRDVLAGQKQNPLASDKRAINSKTYIAIFYWGVESHGLASWASQQVVSKAYLSRRKLLAILQLFGTNVSIIVSAPQDMFQHRRQFFSARRAPIATFVRSKRAYTTPEFISP